MYILADIKRNRRKSRFSGYKKLLLFDVKDLIFIKYICEIYILADMK